MHELTHNDPYYYQSLAREIDNFPYSFIKPFRQFIINDYRVTESELTKVVDEYFCRLLKHSTYICTFLILEKSIKADLRFDISEFKNDEDIDNSFLELLNDPSYIFKGKELKKILDIFPFLSELGYFSFTTNAVNSARIEGNLLSVRILVQPIIALIFDTNHDSITTSVYESEDLVDPAGKPVNIIKIEVKRRIK